MPDPNPDIETGSGSSRKLSRREFLKLAGIAGPAVALKIPRPEGAAKPDNGVLLIETPEARYFPIYEVHQLPASGEDLKSLPPQDVFLYEGSRDTRYFIDSPPQVIIDVPVPTGLSDSKREYLIPRDHLEWLRENNTKICIEGYTLSGSSILTAVLVMGGEALIGAAGLLYHGPSKAKESSKKEVTRRQFLKLASGLAAAWGLSLSAFLAIGSIGKTEVKESALERVMIKAHGLLSHAHPENSLIFFRNIMFARKLQFLGEVASKEKGRKAQITYNVGKGHAGIEDFLFIGKDWTLNFLNIMPNQFLKGIIDTNGGLENFCSNVLIDPKAQNPIKTILIDQELRAFLVKKLHQSY